MHTRTISGPIDHTVTLGTAHYARAVTITPSGSIVAGSGDNGIVTTPRTGHASVFNAGTVRGGDGISNDRANGTNGGIGVDLSCTGNVINNSVILGGHGGYGSYGGGSGGAGLVFATGGHLSNTSTIGGGYGGSASYEDSSAGNGGLGVQLGANVHAQNSGLIYGGQGGIDTDVVDPQGASGAGGAGLVLTGAADFANHGTIQGGNGGENSGSPGGYFYGKGGSGGAGISMQDGGTLSNAGTVIGGAGGGGYYTAGSAGDGIDLNAGGTLTNTGLIMAGAGGQSSYYRSAAGGAGVNLAGGGLLANFGTIIGGAGGNSLSGYSASGGAGVVINGGTLLTAGTIVGGAAGSGNGGMGDAVQFGSDAGTLVVEASAVFDGSIQGNNVDDALVLAGKAAGTLSGFGTTITGITTISEEAHMRWTLEGSIAGTGAIQLGADAYLALTGGPVSIASIVFGTGGGETLYFGAPASVSSTLSGFGTGDRIDLANIQAVSLGYANGTLTLFDAHQNIVDTLTFAGDYNIGNFALQREGQTTDVIYVGSEARVHVTWPHADDLPGPLAWLHR